MKTERRHFLKAATSTAAISWLAQPARLLARWADERRPALQFPADPRERIAVASYPFRDFIAGAHEPHATSAKMPLREFAAHVKQKFNVTRIEPWSEHFLSTEQAYLDELRSAVLKAGSGFANIAADGEDSFYSPDRAVRAKAVAFGKKWIDVASHIGSPSVRINLPTAKDSKPDAALVSESLKLLAAYGEQNSVVVHHENDNPLSENPFFIGAVLDRVGSPWDRALPDCGNSFSAMPAEDAYQGLEQMFARAYAISHVKDVSVTPKGEIIPVDLARALGIAKKHGYQGYFSMEWDTTGDPYAGTEKLIRTTLENIS